MRRVSSFLPLALIAVFLSLGSSACTNINSGEAGVLWKAFGGTQMDQVYDEGFHVVAPWNDMIVYNVKIRDVKEVMDIVTSNGLTVQAEMSVRFRPIREELPQLHKEIGYRYYDEVLGPSFRSASRQVLGQYEPEEIYSTQRAAVETQVLEELQKAIKSKHLLVEGIFLRSFQLPPQLQQAINQKLTQEQKSQEMRFVLERERQEAERKRIEAEGIADFQRIVTQGISERLLKWKGIEATLELAKSQNSKVVIIGNGDDGMPVILSGPTQ